MKIIRNIIYAAFLGVTLLLSGAANADIAASTSGQTATPTELTWTNLFNKDNLTVLEKSIFSSQFGAIMFGSGEQSAAGYASGLLNPLAAMLILVLVSYMVGGGALNTASSGQILGKNWSPVWLPLRVSAGLGLLFQVKGSYSVIQVLVIYLIMAASNAGTAIYRLTVVKVINAEATISAPAANMLPPDAMQLTSVANSAWCANNAWRIVNGESGQAKNEPLYSISYRPTGSVLSTTKVFTGPPTDGMYSMPSGSVLTQISFGKDGECGSFSIGSATSRLYTTSVQTALANVSQVEMTYLNYFGSLELSAFKDNLNSKNFHLHYDNSSGSDEDDAKFRKKIDEYSAQIATLTPLYQRDVINAIKDGFKADNDDKAAILESIKNASWIEAANNIVLVQKFSGAQYEALGYVNQGVVNTAWQKCLAGSLECKGKDTGFIASALSFFASNEHSTTMPMTKIIQKALKSGDPQNDGCGTYDYECAGIKFDKTMGNRVDAALLNGLAAVGVVAANPDVATSFINSGFKNGNAMASMPSVSDFQGHGSPVVMLQSIGLGINSIATGGFASLLVLKVAGHAAGDSVLALGGGAGISTFVDVIWSMTAPLLGVIWLSGMSLAYVTPWILVIRWIWVVFNWAFGSFLAVAAAPLLPVLLTVPEGEGIAGSRAERAIVYLVQQALTPALNVVALFGTLSLSGIFFGLINMVWFSTIGFESQGLFAAAVKLFLYVIVQSAMIWSVAEVLFRTADAICSWFGGGQSHGIQSNVGDKMEGTTNKTEQLMGAGMKGALGAVGKKKDIAEGN